jgi:hypothetical protein
MYQRTRQHRRQCVPWLSWEESRETIAAARHGAHGRREAGAGETSMGHGDHEQDGRRSL